MPSVHQTTDLYFSWIIVHADTCSPGTLHIRRCSYCAMKILRSLTYHDIMFLIALQRRCSIIYVIPTQTPRNCTPIFLRYFCGIFKFYWKFEQKSKTHNTNTVCCFYTQKLTNSRKKYF